MREHDARCPNCHGRGLDLIYVQQQVPVNSVVLVPAREQALGFPRGDIAIGFCAACGFAANTRFDPQRVRYDESCEETQAASATFNDHHRRLAADLVERHRLAGAHVVEIGCGKGEFLSLLCRIGGCRGTGFDPAFVPERIELPAGVRILERNFTAGDDLTDADFLCCKMTLEHIREPLNFLRSVHGALTGRDIPVYFQVPDAGRIYRHCAFWDIYYEHCSYFSESALRSCFEAAGFVVDALSVEYDQQYLALHARAAGATMHGTTGGATADIRRQVDNFCANVEREVLRWRSLIMEHYAMGDRVVLWGGGSKAVAFLSRLDLGVEVDRVIDINPRKNGTWLPGSGHAVMSPEALLDEPARLVVVMNRVYENEIRAWLAEHRLDPLVMSLP